MRRVLVLLLVVAALTPLAIAPARAQGAEPRAELSDLGWLAGHWVGKTARGAHIEEMWMPSRDGLMLGSFRWDQGQGRWLFEFMSLEAASGVPGALTLRLKHFDRALRGQEERAESTTFTSLERSASRVVFEFREDARVVRLVYARVGSDGLTVTFDESEPGKPSVHIEFPYTRVR